MADGGVWTKIYPDVASLGGGKVLQVVFNSFSTETSANSTTFQPTGLAASITPTSASSDILVFAAHNSNERSAGSTNNNGLDIRLVRDDHNVLVLARTLGWTGGNFRLRPGAASFVYRDNPATTSEVTYSTQMASNTSGESVRVQIANTASTIMLLEVSQ